MSRAPFVMPKATAAFSRSNEVHDTTIGWRFVNPLMQAQYGTHSMPETAENVAEDYGVSRADQDAFALRSQTRAGAAIASGRLAQEITPVEIPPERNVRTPQGQIAAKAVNAPRFLGFWPAHRVHCPYTARTPIVHQSYG